jgi:hypothetical protein
MDGQIYVLDMILKQQIDAQQEILKQQIYNY